VRPKIRQLPLLEGIEEQGPRSYESTDSHILNRQVLDVFRTAGPLGVSVSEVATKLSMKVTSVAPRCTELRANRHIRLTEAWRNGPVYAYAKQE